MNEERLNCTWREKVVKEIHKLTLINLINVQTELDTHNIIKNKFWQLNRLSRQVDNIKTIEKHWAKPNNCKGKFLRSCESNFTLVGHVYEIGLKPAELQLMFRNEGQKKVINSPTLTDKWVGG